MVSLLLISKNKKFLLVKRAFSQNDQYSGYWGLPGGGVEPNETPNDALIREIHEELNIHISNFNFLNRYNHNNTTLNVYVFNSPDFNENTIQLNNEHTDFNFFSYYQLHQMNNVIPTVFTFINDYLNNQNL